MNTVTNAERSYYTANVNGKTEKGPCAAMTPYGVIGPERAHIVSYHQLLCKSINKLIVPHYADSLI